MGKLSPATRAFSKLFVLQPNIQRQFPSHLPAAAPPPPCLGLGLGSRWAGGTGLSSFMAGRRIKRGLQLVWGNCCHLSGGTSPGRVSPIHSFTHRWAPAFCWVGWGGGVGGGVELQRGNVGVGGAAGERRSSFVSRPNFQ
jgi:hypothetical protein